MNYRILDNFLPKDIIKEITPQNAFVSRWYEYPSTERYQQAILAAAAKVYSFKRCVGIEEWTHNPHWRDLPGAHFDKDEARFDETGELSFPICSCIYYFKVEDLVGGMLHLKDEHVHIQPKTNRLVLLDPGVYHSITPIETSSARISININPWNYKLPRY